MKNKARRKRFPSGFFILEGLMAATPFVIPVFLPHGGCPHQCVFCNQKAVTGKEMLPDDRVVEEEIRRWLGRRKDPDRAVEIAFYGGNFLGLPEAVTRRLLAIAAKVEGAHIRFSTRPDTITESSLLLLKEYPVAKVEVGVQSMDDRVLRLSGRGHDAAASLRAARMVREAGYALGLQMMLGLPGASGKTDLISAAKILDAAPDFIRIYPTVVLEKSPLAERYRAGGFTPISLSDAVERAARIKRLADEKGVRVVRMGLQADGAMEAEILEGPYHPAFGEMVLSRMLLEDVMARIEALGPLHPEDTVEIRIQEKRLSQLFGIRKQNLALLKKALHPAGLAVVPVGKMAADGFSVRIKNAP